MKKRVVTVFLTGLLAASMLLGVNPACGRSSALFLVLFMYACHSIYCLQLVHSLSATAGSKIPPPSWWSEAFWGSQNITSLPLRTR